MNECKDCLQIQNHEDKIKSLWHAVNELKGQNNDFEKRINDLEVARGENQKDFNRIFDDIEEIKTSLSEIAESIKSIQFIPSKNYEKLKWIAITALISSGIGAFLSYFVTHLK